MQIGTVAYRVHWLILRWPALPSLESFSSAGTTFTSSEKMMLALMYGMMPRLKSAACWIPPPLMMFRKSIRPGSCPPLSTTARTYPGWIPGSGMFQPIL